MNSPANWLETILRSIQEAVIGVDSQGQVRIFSDLAVQLTGIEAADAIGKPIEKVFRLDGFDRSKLAGRWSRRIRGQLTTATNKKIRISWSVTPMVVDSQISGHAISFRDITNQEVLEQQAERSQRSESLSFFVAGIAHDFNNNLQSTIASFDHCPNLGFGTRDSAAWRSLSNLAKNLEG